MNIGIIGTGNRATAYVKVYLSNICEDVRIKALADIDGEKLKRFGKEYFKLDEMPDLYTDYNELLDDESIEAVIICTPDTTHREIAIAALKKGKHVLLEKPFATTIEDCISLYNESKKYNKVFRLGFVLRYAPLYSKVKEIVSRGDLGKLITIEAKETLGYLHGGSFFRRWHRFKKNNGGFLNAKCCHDMDLLNWIADEEPVNVSAFGNRTYFNPREDAGINCNDCKIKNSCRYAFKEEQRSLFSSEKNLCVFNSDKDIVDHEVLNIEYESGLTASFTVTTLSAEANRTMIIFGTEATLYADFAGGIIKVKYIHPNDEIIYKPDTRLEGHGGGDRGICKDFIDSIRSGKYDGKSDALAGLLSTAVALGGEISMERKEVVNIRELIKGAKI
ncbi:MAG TPA: Gfo/Idh/MocA family oxidoreductase [Clostridiaceae bacterium]|nr:Gfo/Idh/MocA family oxidoreductase [Clostridiaceae bacterium]